MEPAAPSLGFAEIHGITLVSELRRLDIDDRPFRRATLRGDVVRIHRGAYIAADEWKALNRHERYRRQVIAAALASRSRPVLSHQSAAAVWGIPIIGQWPKVVHVLTTVDAGTRSENGFRRHGVAIDDEDIVEVDGIRVTSFERTVVDLARETSFTSAVASADWATRPSRPGDVKPATTVERLSSLADRQGFTRGVRKVNRVLDFANPLAESPGESWSRVLIREFGFPDPVLQTSFTDRDGLIGRVDFAWPDHSLVGEFDGIMKYTRSMAGFGVPVEETVVREKIREDRIRALGERMTRWLWFTLEEHGGLFRQLTTAGLPSSRRR